MFRLNLARGMNLVRAKGMLLHVRSTLADVLARGRLEWVKEVVGLQEKLAVDIFLGDSRRRLGFLFEKVEDRPFIGKAGDGSR